MTNETAEKDREAWKFSRRVIYGWDIIATPQQKIYSTPKLYACRNFPSVVSLNFSAPRCDSHFYDVKDYAKTSPQITAKTFPLRN
jgi:hypothetical protein